MSTTALLRPEYILRPVQIWRRIRRDRCLRDEAIRLAWGLPVSITLGTHVGEEIMNHGVSDRIVPEALWRLLDAGEQAVDAGANLGQNTSIMALKTRGGRVHAFEPHPDLYAMLAENVRRWEPYGLASIEPVEMALSSAGGIAMLHESIDLGGNSLGLSPPNPRRPAQPRSFDVELTTLDDYLPGSAPVALLKIDVEGHELEVLRGASRLLTAGQPRDILYEDFGPHPSAPTRLMMEAGFTIFGLFPAWGGPLMVPLVDVQDKGRGFTSNFLATRDPQRARRRLRRRGWDCLRNLT